MENATDEPIIPEEFRDILVYKVCADFRRSRTDSVSVYYLDKYKWRYKSMLYAQRMSQDYPQGFDIDPYPKSIQEVILDVWRNPRVYSTQYSNYRGVN